MQLGTRLSSRPHPDEPRTGGPGKATILCLVAVGVLYVALAGFYSLRTPAWESNDEDSHVQYVTYLRVHHAFPPIAPGNGIEVHQPPLYYAIVGAWGRLLAIPAFEPDQTTAPGATIDSPLQVNHDYTPSQRDEARWLHLLRLPSVLFGLVVVVSAFVTARLLTGSLGCATAAAATVALWPRFLVITGAVNNDSLAYAACAAGLVCVLQSFRTNRMRWFVAAGVALAVAALTKQTTLPVAGVLLMALVVCGAKRRAWRGPAVAALVFAGGSAWWYLRNLFVHGDLLAGRVTNEYLAEVLPALIRPHATLAPIRSELRGKLLTSLWYGAGWNQTELPRAAGVALSVLALIAVAGAIWRGRDLLRSRGLLMACLGGGFVAWGLLVTQTTQNEGRYLFVAIGALATLMVAGTTAIVRPRSERAAVLVYAFWPAILVAVNVYVFSTWLIPYGRL